MENTLVSFVDETKATIPSNYSRLVARTLGLLTSDIPRLLKGSSLTLAEFLTESTLINAKQQIQILDNALEISGSSAFGLTLGKMLTPASHGAMGFLVNSSPNLLAALQAFQTFSPTRMSFVRLELRADPDWLEVHYHIDLDLSERLHRCISEASAITFFDCAEHIIGAPLDTAETHFKHAEPSYSAEYSDCLPGIVRFDRSATIVRIPIEACRISNASANHADYQLAFKQCESMLSHLQHKADSYAYKLQKMMLSHPPGTLKEDEAAAALFISKRTLARYLRTEKTGFRKIRDDILNEQAQDYLLSTKMSVEAVASLLNYHDSSNFRRAFKRWNQVTPDQFRKTNQPTNTILKEPH